jgi:hypothetical protein
MGRHSNPDGSLRIRKGLAAIGAALLAVVGVGWFAGAFAASPPPLNCNGGHAIIDLAPDGTWTSSCGPAPTSSGTPTATTTSPTTPPVTTTAPATTTPPATTTSSPPTTTPAATTTAPPTTTASTPPGLCPVAGANKPGAADPWGGCFPGPGNTGVPAGTTLTAYTGPCLITAANTVIDRKHVTCAQLDIRAPGVVIQNTWLEGTDVIDTNSATAGFLIVDSLVTNGARDQCLCIGDHNFIAIRVEVRGGNRSMYCASTCTVQDSWMHAQQLQGSQHGSGLREEQFTQATHNAFACDFPTFNDATTLGCSAALTGYPDFAPIHDNTIKRNLILASPAASFCVYGGNTGGKAFSSDPSNGTHQVFQDNVFQRGNGSIDPPNPAKRVCANYGPVTDFAPAKVGNVWTGNRYDDGTVINP